jgi:ketol-acid reductoisomerase
MLENQAGQPSLRAMHRQDAEHPIEQIAKLIHQDQGASHGF